MNYTLKKISELLKVDIVGDENFVVNQVSSLENATSTSVVFISDKKFLKFLDNTKSKVVITTELLSKSCNLNIIICENPSLIFSKVSKLINKPDDLVYSVHDSVCTLTSNLNKKITVEPNVVIGKNVQLGNNAFIGANCYIGDYVDIGENSYIYPNVTIYNNVKIGNNIVIHSGTVIGSDGFGYTMDGKNLVKMPQIGGVKIGDNVEIGSCTSIDRGALDNTIIGNGVKIDNQIQIAHNVHIGDNTAISGCVGIAGSAKIGKNCVIGGGVGIKDHVEICDNAIITGMAKVRGDIKEAGMYSSGTPLMLNNEWLKAAARFKQLNKFFLKLK